MRAHRSATLARCLDELDPPAWGSPAYDSYLVTTCHRLRRKPVSDFTVEDLRIMIGQAIGLPFLVPLALDVVEREPLVSGDFYPGDLLSTLLRVTPEFWAAHADWHDRLARVLRTLPNMPPELEEAAFAFRNDAG